MTRFVGMSRHSTAPTGGWSGWAGVVLTALIALFAFTVQWGVVTAKLDHLEKRLDEMIFESRSLRAEYNAIERRVSYLEGQQKSKD